MKRGKDGFFEVDGLQPLALRVRLAIDADLVPISSPVPGRLIELAVTDNQKVTAGDLLFRIGPETYRLEVAQAEAELAVVL